MSTSTTLMAFYRGFTIDANRITKSDYIDTTNTRYAWPEINSVANFTD